jgi:hypothetical protein
MNQKQGEYSFFVDLDDFSHRDSQLEIKLSLNCEDKKRR